MVLKEGNKAAVLATKIQDCGFCMFMLFVSFLDEPQQNIRIEEIDHR